MRGGRDGNEYDKAKKFRDQDCGEEPLALPAVILHGNDEVGKEPENVTAYIDCHGPWNQPEGMVYRKGDVPCLHMQIDEFDALIDNLVRNDCEYYGHESIDEIGTVKFSHRQQR